MKANFFSNQLDRLDRFRGDEAWLEHQLRKSSSRFLPLWRNHNLITSDHQPVVLDAVQASSLLPQAEQPVLLGLDDSDCCWFALDVAAATDSPAFEQLTALGEFQDLRMVGPLLDRRSGSLLAYARAILYWHRQHRYCGRCGSLSKMDYAGHTRTCSNNDCGKVHYPRTDPTVIMLVHDNDHCLLARQSQWPAGMHSVLAGFVEPGESLENAVAREVSEEVGIQIADIRYHSSQPWPFPASIMLGFYARAESRKICVNTQELESARWYSREELLNSPEDQTFHLPRKISIARRLIDEWLAQE